MKLAAYSGKKRHVPPSGGFFVLSHEFHMDIGLFVCTVSPLLPDLFTVVEISVDYKCGYGSKRQAVRHGESGT